MKESAAGSRINVLISEKKLNLNDSIKFVSDNSNGAIATFSGTTRDSNLGRQVKFLEYEAYEPMADRKLSQIANEMLKKWKINKVSIQHRVGRVLFSINRIKEIVPIWKKEYYEDGEIWIGSQTGVEFLPTKEGDIE